MLAVFTVALGTAWALSMAIGISGYLTFGSNVQHNLLDSCDATNPLLSFARVGLAIVVISSYPIQVTVTRASVRSLARLCFQVGASDDDEAGGTFIRDRFSLVTTIGFLAATACVAFTVRDMGIVVDLCGTTGSTILAYIAPGFLYAATFRSERFGWTRMLACLVAIFGLVMFGVGLGLIFVFDV